MDDKARQPAVEPEIIPPDRPGAQPAGERSRAWLWIRTRHGRYDYTARPGPLATALALLAFGCLGGIVLLILLGTFLVLIPALMVCLGLLILSAVLSRNVRRIRGP